MFYELNQQTSTVRVPEILKLEVNYRTHNGILRCASEIVDIIHCFFPFAVDKLAQDRGHFEGCPPTILTAVGVDDLAILLIGSDEAQSQIEFGAHQAVLVRNQESKDNLPPQFDNALVLTIFECKGLEFDDVFVYNFYHDSPATADEWRIMYDYMVQKHPDKPFNGRRANFNAEKHGVICEELKMFYTALTRARVNVVVHDESAAKRGPMFEVLTLLGLVRVFDSNSTESIAEAATTSKPNRGMAVSSSKEEWKRRGDNLYANKLFPQAEICYKKSGDTLLECKSKGHKLIAVAKRFDDVGRMEPLKEAAECFLLSQSPVEAAKCLAHGRQYENAADIWGCLCEWEQAGKLYQKASRVETEPRGRRVALARMGAQSFEASGSLRNALLLLQDVNECHDCIALIDRHPKYVPPEEVSRAQFVRMLADTCLENDDYEQMFKHLGNLPETQQLSYLTSKEKRTRNNINVAEKLITKSDHADNHLSAAAEARFEAAKTKRDQENKKLQRIIEGHANLLVTSGHISQAAGKLASVGDLDGAADILLKSKNLAEIDEAGQIKLQKLQRLRDCKQRDLFDEVNSIFSNNGDMGCAGLALATLEFAKFQVSQEMLRDAELLFSKLKSPLGSLAAVMARLQFADRVSVEEQIDTRIQSIDLMHRVLFSGSVNRIHDPYLMVRTNAAGQPYIHATNFTCLQYLQAVTNQAVTYPHMVIQKHQVAEAIETETKRQCEALIKDTLSFAQRHLVGSRSVAGGCDTVSEHQFRLMELVVYCRYMIYYNEVPSRKRIDVPRNIAGIKHWDKNNAHYLRNLTESSQDLFDAHFSSGGINASAASISRCLASCEIQTTFKYKFWLKFLADYLTIWECRTYLDWHAFISGPETLRLYRLATMANEIPTFRRWLIQVEKELYPSTPDRISFFGEALTPAISPQLHAMKTLYEKTQTVPALPVRGLLGLQSGSVLAPLVYVQHMAMDSRTNIFDLLDIVELCFVHTVVLRHPHHGAGYFPREWDTLGKSMCAGGEQHLGGDPSPATGAKSSAVDCRLMYCILCLIPKVYQAEYVRRDVKKMNDGASGWKSAPLVLAARRGLILCLLALLNHDLLHNTAIAPSAMALLFKQTHAWLEQIPAIPDQPEMFRGAGTDDNARVVVIIRHVAQAVQSLLHLQHDELVNFADAAACSSTIVIDSTVSPIIDPPSIGDGIGFDATTEAALLKEDAATQIQRCYKARSTKRQSAAQQIQIAYRRLRRLRTKEEMGEHVAYTERYASMDDELRPYCAYCDTNVPDWKKHYSNFSTTNAHWKLSLAFKKAFLPVYMQQVLPLLIKLANHSRELAEKIYKLDHSPPESACNVRLERLKSNAEHIQNRVVAKLQEIEWKLDSIDRSREWGQTGRDAILSEIRLAQNLKGQTILFEITELTLDFDRHCAKVAAGQGRPPHQLFQQAIGSAHSQGAPVQAHEHADEDDEADDDLGAFGADDGWTAVTSRKERRKQKQQHSKSDQTRGGAARTRGDRRSGRRGRR
jgi:hypothetical protein